MASSFQQRRLDVTFTLATGTFDGSSDTVKLSGLRISADIHLAGGAQLAEASLRIYGMSQELMNRLTLLAWKDLATMSVVKNTVRVEAGTNDDDMTTVFFGDIYNSMGDYQGAPDVPFIVSARSGFVNKIAPTSPSSFPGTQSVATIMEKLAKRMKLTFENSGVKGTVTDQYLSGTLMDQAQELARTAQIDLYVLPPLLAICPRGTPREGDVVIVSPSSGLVGWPTVDRIGVAFTSLFDPRLTHGGKIKMETSVTPAAGEFFIYSMSHKLSSETPGGPWFTHALASTKPNAHRFGK